MSCITKYGCCEGEILQEDVWLDIRHRHKFTDLDEQAP